MQAHEGDIQRYATPGARLANLSQLGAVDEVRVMGLVVDTRVVRTRRNDKMAFVRLEDAETSVECVFFAEAFSRSARALEQGEPILVTGKIEAPKGDNGRDGADDAVKLIASSAEPLSDLRTRTTREVRFQLDVRDLAGDRLDRFLYLLQAKRGSCRSRLVMRVNGRIEAELQMPQLPVDPSTDMEESVTALFGRTDVVALS
jgi:DNA polymerase III subunit alpha